MIIKRNLLKILIVISLLSSNLTNAHSGPVVRLTMHKKRGPDVHNCTVEHWTTCKELKSLIAREYGIRPKQVITYDLYGQEFDLNRNTTIPGLNSYYPLSLIVCIKGYTKIDKKQARAIRRVYRS